jgi:valyl-tRNA synthetase
MIMSGLEYKNEYPFKDVYFTGLVRDDKRRKMSKSLGNSPDLFETFEKYSADGVRLGVLLCAPAGNDLLYKHDLSEQGRNFANKLWNAFRLIKGWEVDENAPVGELNVAVEWMDVKLQSAIAKINDAYEKYRLSEAAMEIYKLIWDDFCSWYLEMIKPGFGLPIASSLYQSTINFMEQLITLLHPMMPFITEEIWQNIRERKEGESISTTSWPTNTVLQQHEVEEGEKIQTLISEIRNLRSSLGISPKESLDLVVKSNSSVYQKYAALVIKLANIKNYSFTTESVVNAKSFIISTDEFFVPVAIDVEKEKEELEKELQRQEGFLLAVSKKLSNEKFVNNAPEDVVAIEKKKQSDAQQRIEMLTKALQQLNK